MPFERLRTIALADIRHRGLDEARLEEYAAAWSRAAVPASRALMPCPACFANGMLSALKGRSVSDGYAAAICSTCNMTLQFSRGPKQTSPPTAAQITGAPEK